MNLQKPYVCHVSACFCIFNSSCFDRDDALKKSTAVKVSHKFITMRMFKDVCDLLCILLEL